MKYRKQVGVRQSRRRPESSGSRTDFRRYRTLGRQVDQAGPASERSRKHHLQRVRRKLLLLLALLAGLLIVLAIGMSQFVATVKVSTDDPAIKLDAGYQKTIDKYYRSRPLERFSFWLQQAKLEDFLKQQHAEIAGVDIEPVGMGEAQYSIELRQPVARWRLEGDNYYVDKSGVIFKRNYYSQPKVQINDNSGVDSSKELAVASQSFLSFTGLVVGYGERYSLPVTAVTIPRGAIRDVEVKFKGQPYKVRMNTGGEAGEQFEDAKRTIDWLNKTNRKAKSVDVRVQRRAAYR